MIKITAKELEGDVETVYHAAQEQDSKRLTCSSLHPLYTSMYTLICRVVPQQD